MGWKTITSKKPPKYYLTMAAMVANEAPYLEDWIKYHQHIGIEHFYLYENESTDNTQDVLKSLATRYPITWRPVVGEKIVQKVYMQCIQDHKKDSRWIAFMDIDEYLVCSQPLKEFLEDYEKFPALTVHWRIFGSNGRAAFDAAPVVERFTMRGPDVDLNCKSIVDPTKCTACYTSHRFAHPTDPVDEYFIPITTAVARTDIPTADLIQINHYATKSYAEHVKRRTARRLSGSKVDIDALFDAYDLNEVEDLKAYNIWKSITFVGK